MSAGSSGRRVLVLMDASPASLAAAETTAEVAAALGVPLRGLFVEETELLSLAEHPLAREVDVFGGAVRPVNRTALARRLRIQAARARARLGRAAARHHLRWSFEVARGEVAEVAVRAAGGELVALGRIGWSGGPRRLGRTARTLLERREGAMLLDGRHAPADAPVGACVTESDPAAVLDAATSVARRSGRPLHVLVFAPDGPTGEGRLREVKERLAAAEIPAEVERRAPEEAVRLDELPAARRWGLAVLPEDGPVARSELPRLIAALECPVLLVR